MPKETTREFASRMVQMYKGILRTDKSGLYCRYCNCCITGNKTFNVKQHFDTKKHKLRAEIRTCKKDNRQLIKEDVDNKLNSFNMDLCKMCVSANIPLHKITHPAMVTFLEKYTKNKVPSVTTLRQTNVSILYEETLIKLRALAKNKNIWISIDETTDEEERLIMNLIFGILDGEENVAMLYLLNVAVVEDANATTISAFVNDSLHVLWPEGIQYDKVLFAVTNAAAYMIETMKGMRTQYPKMLHCTCFAQDLHRLAELIQLEFTNVNALISNMEAVYSKAQYRRCQFRSDFPSQPCLTREGIWLDAAEYYYINFNDVRSAVRTLNDDDSEFISQANELFNNNSIKKDLGFITSHFKCISAGITKLQNIGLSLLESIGVIEEIRKNLSQMENKNYLDKLNSVLKRNVGYESLRNICSIIFNNVQKSDIYIDSLTPLELSNFKFCPSTSVDVERTCSAYSTLLTDQSISLLFEDLKKHLIVYYNSSTLEIN